MKALILTLMLVLLWLPSGCSSSPKKEIALESPALQGKVIPLVGTSVVHRYELPNGLRLLVVENHSSPTFAYHTWYRVGSRDEEPNHTGLAHLFEHMMFKETTHLKEGEFERLMDAAGAQGNNAFTTRDYTAYVQELPKDQLDLIARLESDRMVNLVVNDKIFKTELEVVQNERRLRHENNPDGELFEELFGTAFTVHPYHWPTIGYAQDLEKMTPQEARDFYHAYYSPNHATVIVVGDVQPAEVHRTIEKYYGGLPASPSPVHLIQEEPPQISARHKEIKLNIQVEKLLMGYHIPGVKSDDLPILDVLQAILTGGRSSRLYRALVDRGIASGVDSDDLTNKDPSLFIISVGIQKGKRAAQAEAVILRELSRMGRDLVPGPELERAKNRLSFGFYEGLDSNSEKAQFLGTYESIANDFEVGLEQYKKSEAVTSEQVQQAVKKYLIPRNRTVITGVPK